MSNKLANDVMSQIKEGRVRMRPRWHFVALSCIAIASIGLLSIVVVYFVNLITIAVRIQLGSTPMYGARERLSEMYNALPWWLVLAVISLVSLLVYVLKKHSRIYRLRTWKVVALVLLLGVTLGAILSYTPLGLEHHEPQKTEQNQSERLRRGIKS